MAVGEERIECGDRADEGREGGGIAEECGAEAEEISVEDEIEKLRSVLQQTRDQLREAEARAEDYLQQLQRVQADFQNFKKRVERDRERSRRQSRAEAVRQWLPVIDNLERVTASAGDEDDPVRRGVEMILRQIDGVLREMGVERIPAVGENFDPRVHEAVAHVCTDEQPDGRITEQLQAGYLLGDVLIRPARVQVAKNPGGVGNDHADECNCEDEEGGVTDVQGSGN